jgi:hypothetical protein
MAEATFIGFQENRSPLDWLERSFELLIAGPQPLMVNGRGIEHGLPARLVSIAELRELMPALTPSGQDAVWRYLLRLARSGREAWMVVCCGLALPGLRTAAREVTTGYAGDPADLDAEILEGFVRAVKQIDTGLDGVCGRLWRAAYNAGRRARYAECAHGGRYQATEDLGPMQPHAPVAHPDVVLAQAVTAGALTYLQAELVGRVYLEKRPLRKVAAELGLSYGTAQRTLAAAKIRIAVWLGTAHPPTSTPSRRSRTSGSG